MKKILLFITAFLFLVFPVQALVINVNDDIQPDAVRVNQFVDETTTNAQEITGEHIKSFDSKIQINKEGTISIVETIEYDFSTLEKHGIFRDIPYIKTNQDKKKYKMTLSNFSVTDENQRPYNFTQSDNGEKISLKIGDANKLVTGIHNYIISYQVSGALTYYSDHDELYWNITGNDWTVPIGVSTSEVKLPDGIKKEDIKTICYAGAYGATTISDCNGKSLSASEGLTVVVGFPKNIVAVLEPKEVVDFWETIIGKLVMGLMGLIGLIWYFVLPFYIIYRWLKFGRDPKSTVGVTTAWFDPPKTQDGSRFLTPGEVGTLGDETVDMKDITASIVDLARRGYLIIDERKKGDFYLIKNKNIDSSLLTYEKTILTKFFVGEKEIRIKDQELSSEMTKITNEMYEQVVEDKLFDKNPQSTRTGYYVLAGVATFTGNFFLGIVAFLFGRVMPRKTLYGVDAKNISFSLKNFLTSQKRQLEFQADKQMMFERLLPFAVAFGVEKIWAKRFESLNLTQPKWYRSYSNANFSSYLLVNSLSSSFRSINTAMTPTRSSSGFSSGFGGGGFSGGGGGGGGGGSW